MNRETGPASPHTRSISRRIGGVWPPPLTRRGRGRSGKSPSWRRAATDSDAHGFEIERFRNAFASGIRPSSGTAARPVKHKRNRGLRGVPTEIRAGQTTYIANRCNQCSKADTCFGIASARVPDLPRTSTDKWLRLMHANNFTLCLLMRELPARAPLCVTNSRSTIERITKFDRAAYRC